MSISPVIHTNTQGIAAVRLTCKRWHKLATASSGVLVRTQDDSEDYLFGKKAFWDSIASDLQVGTRQKYSVSPW